MLDEKTDFFLKAGLAFKDHSIKNLNP